jgi:hypothetical protein
MHTGRSRPSSDPEPRYCKVIHEFADTGMSGCREALIDLDTELAPEPRVLAIHPRHRSGVLMIERISSAPVAPVVHSPPSTEGIHLMLVETPNLTPRGLLWLERAQVGAFDGVELQRLIRLEKLSLG